MKTPILLASFGLLFLLSSCKTTMIDDAPQTSDPKETQVDRDEDVAVDVVPDTISITQGMDMPTQTISMVQYYKIERDAENKKVYIEKVVEGDATFSTDEEGNELMQIVVMGTQEIIHTQKMEHPVLKEDVYVDLGDITQSRER